MTLFSLENSDTVQHTLKLNIQ